MVGLSRVGHSRYLAEINDTELVSWAEYSDP